MNIQTEQTGKDRETSKFLSYVLRHSPESIGLSLDSEGWANIEELLACTARRGKRINLDHLLKVVEESDKKRFSISEDGLRIRAVQGHSTTQVDISFTPQIPPQYLFHGTAKRFIESIHTQGLVPGSRQYVHLSPDQATAVAVGKRHGKPIVLRVDAFRMYEAGFEFFHSENGVWLTKYVPLGYFSVLE